MRINTGLHIPTMPSSPTRRKDAHATTDYWQIAPIPPSPWWGSGSPRRAPMPTTLIAFEPHLDMLFTAGLLCDVCQERPWTQRARTCAARICADCAEGEPDGEEG